MQVCAALTGFGLLRASAQGWHNGAQQSGQKPPSMGQGTDIPYLECSCLPERTCQLPQPCHGMSPVRRSWEAEARCWLGGTEVAPCHGELAVLINILSH